MKVCVCEKIYSYYQIGYDQIGVNDKIFGSLSSEIFVSCILINWNWSLFYFILYDEVGCVLSYC